MARLPKKRDTGKVQRVVVTRKKPTIPLGLRIKLARAYGKPKPKPGLIIDTEA